MAGERFVEASLITGAEDFSYYANEVPGMFFFLGIGADDPAMVYPNHSPYFYADERALPVGVKAMTALALDFMNGSGL